MNVAGAIPLSLVEAVSIGAEPASDGSTPADPTTEADRSRELHLYL